jgi:hypothetical protein
MQDAEAGWHIKRPYQIEVNETDAPSLRALKRVWNEADEVRKMWRYASRDERQEFVKQIQALPGND